ncbi:MAG: ATP-binding cassette domain-containing protein [Candidatus Nanoarchaeia archaeon]|nr:ATP-binding cassette domain-containing protein [Candidatus Nanoarchaeia archaeon]
MEDRIILENISKKFYMGYTKDKTALERAVSLFLNRESRKDLVVLNNVSFKIKSGENIGIIGRNGSGKSTLLRVIAGIYIVDSGSVKTNGKLVYLTGFGQGLNPKLTMRENIFLIGSILDLSQRDIRLKFEDIVNFSGLKDFLDTKVYKFSLGMINRLNFSVGIYCLKHSNPDILLLDEVFRSGGDLEFQNKVIKKMEDFIKGGTTVVLVSHDMDLIKRYCTRALWIDCGKILMEGNPLEVVKEYIKSTTNPNSIKIS